MLEAISSLASSLCKFETHCEKVICCKESMHMFVIAYCRLTQTMKDMTTF